MTLAPVIGDIPGVPTIIGVIVFLFALQLLLGRECFWLPRWLLRRSVARHRLGKTLTWLRRPARFLDRFLRQRLTIFVHGAAVYAIAVVCLGIALAMPAMEVVPFSANGGGAALTAFGLALIARDGLLALLALAFTTVTVGVVAYNLL